MGIRGKNGVTRPEAGKGKTRRIGAPGAGFKPEPGQWATFKALMSQESSGVGVYGIGMGGRACPSAVTVTCWEPFANVVTDAVKVVAVNSKEPNAAPVATSIT